MRPGPDPRLRVLAPLSVLLLLGCATPNLAVDDAVRFDDGAARLVAFAEERRGWLRDGIQNVEVRFAVDGQEVGSAQTDERGFAKAIVQVARPADRFTATAQIGNRRFHSEARLVEWRTDRVIVACDIDSTISQTSLKALFFADVDDASKPIEGSPEALQEIHRNHQILYVTARPRFTLEKTRLWLKRWGYPDEPVVTSLTVGDALDQSAYKTRALGSLRKFYENLLIGIGNTNIDSKSYGAHGMLTLLIQPEAEVGQSGAVVRLRSWEQVHAFFRLNRELLHDPVRLAAALAGEPKLRLP